MPTTYTIVVLNNSDYPQTFFFFSERPKATDIDSEDIYVNSLYSSAIAAPNTGTVFFQISKTTYAICAIATGNPNTDTIVTTADSREVTLGGFKTYASKTKVHITPNCAQFTDVTEQVKLNNPPSGFVIETNPFSSQRALIGLGGVTNVQGLIAPLAVTLAQPNKKCNFFPVTTYYVATGDYEPGRIVDFSEVSATAAKCSFKHGITQKIVTYNPDGTWGVSDGTD